MFPKNTVQFDNALLMTEIKHEWHSVEKWDETMLD